MLAYIILFGCIGIIFLLPKKYYKKCGLILLMVVFAIFFGTRNNVAVDDLNYIKIFYTFSNSLENINGYPNVELIFKVICRIIGFLHMNYKAVFLLYASLSFTFLGLFLKELNLNKRDLFIFIMFFLGIAFFTYMTVMRQFLAITMALYGLALFNEKKYKRTIALILISVIFHNSTIVVLILLPLFWDKFKIDYKFKIAIPILVMILGETGIINCCIKLVANNLKYGQYVLDEGQKAFAGSGITHYFYLVIYIIQCILFKNNADKKYEFIERGQAIYFIAYFATINSGFAIRVSYLFLIFLCLLFITFIRAINMSQVNIRKLDTKKIELCTVIFTYVILTVLITKNLITLQGTNFMTNNFSVDFFNEKRIEDKNI